MPKSGLIVYVDGKQQDSQKVIEFLRANRCSYIKRDVTESGMAEMELQAIHGTLETPVVVWEGHTVAGYDEGALRALIERESS
jgi:arsenate reductase-like glutaredoxin family protein